MIIGINKYQKVNVNTNIPYELFPCSVYFITSHIGGLVVSVCPVFKYITDRITVATSKNIK